MYAGFDRMTPPGLDGGHGDAQMRAMLAHTNLRWAGFYLGHDARQESDTDWTRPRGRVPAVSGWRYYRSEGWGLAPLVFARQFIGPSGHAHANPDWTAANGADDGRRHVRRARASEIEADATLYLDLELGGFMNQRAFPSYLGAWRQEILAGGYRPGVYCWPVEIADLARKFPDIAMWIVDPGGVQPHVYDEAGRRLALPPPSRWSDPTEGQWADLGSVAFQFAWYNPDRRTPQGGEISSSQLPVGPTRNGLVLRIDYDAARVPDPAHPEDPGALVMTPYPPRGPALFAVRPGVVVWTQYEADVNRWDRWGGGMGGPGAMGVGDVGYGRWFDTASAAAVSRAPDHVDLFGTGVDGSLWTAWANPQGEWTEHPWTLNPTMPARPRSPVAAVSRRPGQLDVFFVNTHHEVVTTWWAPQDTDWAAHTGPITHGFSTAPGTDLTALASPHDPDALDVFAIDENDACRWTHWKPATGWTTETVPNAALLDPRLGVRAAHHQGRLHLLVAGRDGTVSHLVRDHADHGTPEAWSLAFSLPQTDAAARPVALRLLSVGDLLVAVAVTAHGELVWSAWNGLTWTLPGVDTGGTVPYSTCGRLAAVALDDATLDVALGTLGRKVVVRRLRRDPANPLRPFAAGELWETMLS
ncbi:glycoside hydrolase domain-containing protein [Streptomyces sp. 4N509B]|uniref:glycoside hydrolase domain-containing protein n=1 Tax=Streptomyces sp. 4N509B TaxID=3457413 RepID=UPI003FD3AAED